MGGIKCRPAKQIFIQHYCPKHKVLCRTVNIEGSMKWGIDEWDWYCDKCKKVVKHEISREIHKEWRKQLQEQEEEKVIFPLPI